MVFFQGEMHIKVHSLEISQCVKKLGDSISKKKCLNFARKMVFFIIFLKTENKFANEVIVQ